MITHDTDVSRGAPTSRSEMRASGPALPFRPYPEPINDATALEVSALSGGRALFVTEPSNTASLFEPEISMLSAALALAARNLPVFPCDARNKAPLTLRGFHNATTQPASIEAFWSRHPTAMIGVRTGSQAGFFAVDPDVPKKPGDPDGLSAWEALVEGNGGLPPTHTHVTPSGGRHLLFQYPDDRHVGNREGALPKGVNVRGEGGYIIMAPSRRKDGLAYQIADPAYAFHFAAAGKWLLDVIEQQPTYAARGATPLAESRARRISVPYAEAALKYECEAVADARPGDRNNALNRSAFSLGTLVGAGILNEDRLRESLFGAATTSGLIEDDGHRAVRATIESGLRAGASQPRTVPPEVRRREESTSTAAKPADSSAETNDRGDGPSPPSEDAVALLYAAQHSEVRRYCDGLGGWYQWGGQRWEPAPKGRVFHECREHARSVSVGCEAKTRISVGRAAFAAGVERFARADPLLAVKAETWDADPFLLATPGGTVDLRTGALRPADARDGITKLAAVAPADEPDCPLWISFLDAATGSDAGMIHFMQQWCGYALTGDTREHALIFVFGDGGNGKSVFVNVLTGILSDYATTAAMETFIASRFDRHPTDLAMLRGARLVTASETEGDRQWAESRIKQMTGGDLITARFMRQDHFTFRPTFKLTIIGNHKPGLRNVDDAARRRFNLVPFTRRPASPDRQLEEKLKGEWPGILRWMIEGCLDWQTNGLVRPLSVTEATDAYFEDQDLMSDWIAEECDQSEGLKSSSQELFSSWSAYAKARGEPPTTKRNLSEALQKRGFRPVKNVPTMSGKRVRGFEGIEVRVEVPHYADD